METIYNSAIVDRDTYGSITQKIAVLKKNLDTPEKIHNFIKQDDVRKKEYLDAMNQEIAQTILYKSIEHHDNNKADLTDCTFIIPFKKDFDERLVNLTCLLNFIGKHFNTKILVFDQGTSCSFDNIHLVHKTNIDYYYLQSASVFSRTIVSNFLIQKSTSKILVINDTDCFTFPDSYQLCKDKLMNEGFKLLHPFGTPPGSFEITEKSSFMKDYAIQSLKVTSKPNFAGVGGILFIDRELYSLLGNENIHFISYSPEDIERVKRIRKLGFKCSESYNQQIAGPNNKYMNSPLFHLNHPRTEQSTILHKYYVSNELLNHCLEQLTKEELIAYYYHKSGYQGSLDEYQTKLNNLNKHIL